MAEKRPAPRSREPAGRGRKGSADPVADPAARARELGEELFRLRFQFATRQLTNTARIRQVRREIARMRTLERQRQLRGRQ